MKQFSESDMKQMIKHLPQSLVCGMVNIPYVVPSVTSIHAAGFKNITRLPNLTSIQGLVHDTDLRSLTKLVKLECCLNRNPDLQMSYLPSSLTDLTVRTFASIAPLINLGLKKLTLTGPISPDISQLTTLQELTCSYWKEIPIFPASLHTLNLTVYYCQPLHPLNFQNIKSINLRINWRRTIDLKCIDHIPDIKIQLNTHGECLNFPPSLRSKVISLTTDDLKIGKDFPNLETINMGYGCRIRCEKTRFPLWPKLDGITICYTRVIQAIRFLGTAVGPINHNPRESHSSKGSNIRNKNYIIVTDRMDMLGTFYDHVRGEELLDMFDVVR